MVEPKTSNGLQHSTGTDGGFLSGLTSAGQRER
jgi:hypothetical protein